MPRIPLVSAGNLNPDQERVYKAIAQGGGRAGRVPAPYRLSLHCPELTDKWQQLGEVLRCKITLSPRLAELAILITARYWTCQHIWYAHEPHARKAGLPVPVIDRIRKYEPPAAEYSEERAIFDYCAQLLVEHVVADRVHAAVLERFGTVGIVELTALIGYYVMVAMALNAHQYALPEGVVPPL